MSERGVFVVDRGIWDHPALASNEPYSRREAWLWLISQAAWKPYTKTLGSITVDLDRGQLAASIRFLADKWGWSKSSVERFIAQLRGPCRARGRPKKSEKIGGNSGTLIETASGTGVLVITICNYDKYQTMFGKSGTHSGTPIETEAGQQRDKEENNKNKDMIICAHARAEPSSASNIDLNRVETACRSAAGVENHPSPGLLIIAPILELLRQGFDLEVDVLPSIRRQAKGRSPRTTWSYFVPGIIDDRNKRLAIGTAARGSVEAEGPVDQRSLEASWKWALDQEAKTGAWPSRSIRKSEIPKAFIDRHRSEAAAKHTAA